MTHKSARLENGKIVIDWQWLAADMNDDDMREMMTCAAFSDHFIGVALHVAATGRTEDGNSWFGAEAMHEIRGRLVPLMPTIAQEAIEGANRRHDAADARWQKTLSEMWSKERAADCERSQLLYVIEGLRAERERLQRALSPFVASYRKAADPVDDSDLDNEQPRAVTVTLGDCRYASQQISHPEHGEVAHQHAAGAVGAHSAA